MNCNLGERPVVSSLYLKLFYTFCQKKKKVQNIGLAFCLFLSWARTLARVCCILLDGPLGLASLEPAADAADAEEDDAALWSPSSSS